MSFAVEFPVRFQDVDPAGILFFGRIYDYCHQAYEEFWAGEGMDKGSFFSGADYLVPIVHSEADYRAPIRHGDRVRVEIVVVQAGRASFTLHYAVTGPAGDLRAEARTVHAFVARATMKPVPIPDPLRSILLRHLSQKPAPDRRP